MVAHNGAEYLPETLSALAAQTRPADFCVGVDAGSTDASASLLQLGLPVGSPVTGAGSRSGFGAAVQTGLEQLPRRAESQDSTQEWLWLLHDDSAPDPGALAQLLRAVELAPSVTIAGTKQVEWENPRKLIDVGVSISRWAERLTMIDVDELDQGQYDSRSDVFAVNSAGMLIRRDAWDALGGFDPALPGTGDDIDLCWRNRLAGNRVVVVPSARIRHAGSRPNSAASARAARKAEVFLRLKHAPGWQVPFLALGAVLGGFGRFFLGMLAKDPGYAAGSLVSSIAAVLRPMDLYRSRRKAAATRRLPRSTVRALITTPREVREHRRSVHESDAAANAYRVETPGAAQAYEPSGDAHDDFTALAGPGRAFSGAGALAAALLLTAASVAGLHRLIGAPALTGGALLPVSDTLAAIWANAGSWWSAVGAGYPGHGDPFDYVLWLLGVAGLGNANAAVVVLVLLAMPLAGLAAWFASGVLTRRPGARFWAAMVWGTLPALQVSLGEGRLGALVAHIVLPLTVLAMARAVGAGTAAPETRSPADHHLQARKPGVHGVPSWTAAAAAGLLLAVLTASAPLLLVLAVLLVLVLSLRLRSRARTLWWSLLAPAALMLPVVLSASGNIRALAADPGVPLAFAPAALWQQLLGYPAAFGSQDPLAGLEFLPAGPWALVLALLVGGPLAALSAAALFLPGRAGTARLGWLMAIAALALSAASAYVVTGNAASALVTPFPAPLVSAAVFALLCAALPALDAALAARKSETGQSRRPATAVVALAVLLGAGPAASLAAWTVPQAAGAATAAGAGGVQPGTLLAVRPTDPRVLPATAADRGNSPDQTRSLVLTVGPQDEVTATLMRAGGSTLDGLSAAYAARAVEGTFGDETLAADDDALAALRGAVAVITAGTGVDPRADLARLGVGFVVLQTSDTAAELLADRLDAVPGLTAVGQTGSGWLWRVTGTLDEQGTETVAGQTARVRIVDDQGQTLELVPSAPDTVDAEIPAGAADRRLVLAERADTGWQASLDGTALEPATDGWAQAFELPAEGGKLSVSYSSPWEPWTGVVQVIVFGLTLLLAVPTPSRSGAIRLPGRQGPVRAPAAAAAPAGDDDGAAHPGAGSGQPARQPEPEPEPALASRPRGRSGKPPRRSSRGSSAAKTGSKTGAKTGAKAGTEPESGAEPGMETGADGTAPDSGAPVKKNSSEGVR